MHRIRLRGPWQKSYGDPVITLRIPVPEALPAPLPTRPASDASEQLGINRSQPVRYQRTFNRPTGLDANSRVLIRIEHWIGDAIELQINQHSLPMSAPPLEVDVTEFLKPHNCFALTLTHANNDPASQGQPTLDGEVSILIIGRR